MKKIKDFFKTNKYAITWTISYIAVMFLVLLIMFGFNIFSGHDWSVLMRARLHGFAGFTFFIMLLAALPLYVATTSIIVRTGKPLFKIGKAKEEKKEAAAKEEKKEEELTAPLPDGIPTELRGAFLRARQNAGNRPPSAFDIKDVYNNNEPAQSTTEEKTEEVALPIPDNFDFSAPTEPASNAPVFREISFGDDTNDTPAPTPTITTSPLIEHLGKKKYDFKTDGDIVIANGMAIATHSDLDFWIADSDTWFAAGKQKPSPVSTAIDAGKKHNVQPAIYLESTNIMDLDTRITEWESNGITVLKDLSTI